MCLGAGLSNDKGPWLFVRYMMGMKSYPVISGDFFIHHEISIPIKQPVCDLGQFCWAGTMRATKLVMSLLSWAKRSGWIRPMSSCKWSWLGQMRGEDRWGLSTNQFACFGIFEALDTSSIIPRRSVEGIDMLRSWTKNPGPVSDSAKTANQLKVLGIRYNYFIGKTRVFQLLFHGPKWLSKVLAVCDIWHDSPFMFFFGTK